MLAHHQRMGLTLTYYHKLAASFRFELNDSPLTAERNHLDCSLAIILTHFTSGSDDHVRHIPACLSTEDLEARLGIEPISGGI